jgi:predicted nucleic acid-binding protein
LRATYLDSSAIVKLAVEEPESAALHRYCRRRTPLVSSALAKAEVSRALLPRGEEGLLRARETLARFDLIRVSDRILEAAGKMLPPDLRSLDAIHLATADVMGGDLGTLVCYDDRLTGAARLLGMRTASPS